MSGLPWLVDKFVDLSGTFSFTEAMILTQRHHTTTRRQSWPETWCAWYEPDEPAGWNFPMLKEKGVVCFEAAPSDLLARDWVLNLPR